MIELREVTMENFDKVIRLKLDEFDKTMVASNLYSLAEAFADKVSIPRAIYADNQLVGFIMYEYKEEEKKGYISRLMIANEYQRKGYGRAGLTLAIEYLKKHEGIISIRISYHAENTKGRTLYLDLGFVENGEIDCGETVAVMELL